MNAETGDRGQRDIRERTFAFATRVVAVVNAVPRTTAGYVVARQLTRAGTSVGANVEEAEAAHSHREFIRKINIARAEAREAHYWLRLLGSTKLVDAQRLAQVVQEANELISILTAITRNARRNEEHAD